MKMFNDIMFDIMLLGNQVLGIEYKDGTYIVRDSWENYSIVFRGSYEKCYAYCKEQERDYLESLI